jgi:hypothetical protein
MESIVVYYPAAETPLTREELSQAIGTVLDANPKMAQAFRQILGERLARATVEAAQPELTERSAGHAGGRLAEIASLQHEIANCIKQARELNGSRTKRSPEKSTRSG